MDTNIFVAFTNWLNNAKASLTLARWRATFAHKMNKREIKLVYDALVLNNSQRKHIKEIRNEN